MMSLLSWMEFKDRHFQAFICIELQDGIWHFRRLFKFNLALTRCDGLALHGAAGLLAAVYLDAVAQVEVESEV